MHIKQFREHQVKVADPIRPGKRVIETRFHPTGAHEIVDGSTVYTADEKGWLEVPDALGQRLRGFRGGRGEKYFTPEEVNEEVAIGAIAEDDEDVPAEPAGSVSKPEKANAAKKAS
jgi:hypothetical protein